MRRTLLVLVVLRVVHVFAFEPLFDARIDYLTEYASYSVFCADLDGDADQDLAVANFESGNVSILKNNGDGTFANVEIILLWTK